jgi:predicted nucleic acid-binding OB-fold protein
MRKIKNKIKNMDEQTKIKKALLAELNLSDISEEKQDELLAKMGEVILKKIFIETVEKLDEVGRKHFSEMLNEERTVEEIEEFLKIKIPDYDIMVERIVKELKDKLKTKL